MNLDNLGIIFQILHRNKSCGISLEPSRQDFSIEESQNVFLIKKNKKIISKLSSLLLLILNSDKWIIPPINRCFPGEENIVQDYII